MHKRAIPFALMTAMLCAVSTAGGAHALPGVKKATSSGQKVVTPEIQNADQRVQQAKAQVEVATKQLNAARALLTAAKADLKAAETELGALQLRQTAQGLVDETGMTPAKAAPVSLASKPPVIEEDEQKPASTTTSTSAPVPQGDSRIRSGEDSPPPEAAPIMLR